MATSGRSEADNSTVHGSDEGFVRALGLFPATTVNMSQMVGIGPFITIPLMISAMGGPQALIGWVLGAVLAMADGLVWAELGAAMPAAGGSYVYLREAYQYSTGLVWMALGAVAYLIWARYEKVWPFGPKEIREAFLEEQSASPQTE